MKKSMHVPRITRRIVVTPCARPAEDGRLHILETAVPAVIRRLLPCLLLLGAALTGGGCSRQPVRFFEYESGKINLERITYVTPRIKAGVDEFPLTAEGIEQVLGNLRDGRYAFFDVQAIIVFDDFTWRAYRSRTFDKEKPPTPAEIASVKRELKKALSIYRAIR